MNDKRILSLIGLSVIFLLTFWVGNYFYQRHIYVITDNAFQRAEIVNVSTQSVSGKITALHKEEFETVKKGEPLFDVDDSIYKKDYQSLSEKLKSLKEKKKALEIKLNKLKEQLPLNVEAMREKLKIAKKELGKVKLALKTAKVSYKTSVSKAEAVLKASIDSVKSAETNLKYWENRYKRYKSLYEKRVIAKEQFEEIVNGYKKAKADFSRALASLRAAKENLKEAKTLKNKVNQLKLSVAEAKERVKQAKISLKSALAELKTIEELKVNIKELEKEIKSTEEKREKLKKLVEYCHVKSPINGVIAKKWKEKGDFVSPGLPVYSLYSPSSFYVLAWIEEDKVPFVKKGAEVKAELETCRKTFYGKVTAVGNSAGSVFALIPRDTSQGEFTRVTQRVPVKIKLFKVPNKCIKPGTNVTVYIRKE